MQVKELGKPKDVVEVTSAPIGPELEWGEVLVNIRAAPINPGDFYAVQVGAGVMSDDATLKPPFVGGSDGVGVVVKVRK